MSHPAPQSRIAVFALLLGLAALPGAAQQQNDLQFHTIPPCVFLDTRIAGGAFASGETRAENVVGSGSFAAQGGSVSGCGVPGFSGGLAQVQAVEVNLIAVAPVGPGHLQAYAADAPSPTSFLNYQYSAVGAIANTGAVAVAQTPAVGDLKIKTVISGAHVVGSVVGYYTKLVQTVNVHPVPGDIAASGAALLAAVAGIADNSATKHYVVQLEPGVYDVGTTMLQMKDYVDIAGAGRTATTIQGQGNNVGFLVAVVKNAVGAELRDLKVTSLGATFSTSIAILLSQFDSTVRRVDAVSGNATSNWGIRDLGTSSTVEDVKLDVQGGTNSYGIANTGGTGSAPVIRRAVIQVSGATSGYGIYNDLAAVPAVVRDVEATVTATANAYGFYADYTGGFANTLSIANSTFKVSGGSTNNDALFVKGSSDTLNVNQTVALAAGTASYGLSSPESNGVFNVDRSELTGATGSVKASTSTVHIGASRLGGAVTAGAAKCAASYDGTTYSSLSTICT